MVIQNIPTNENGLRHWIFKFISIGWFNNGTNNSRDDSYFLSKRFYAHLSHQRAVITFLFIDDFYDEKECLAKMSISKIKE
ncbi:hypothetical protein J2Y03_004420 [Neobacillus niacini]|uniref:hypothetical protein n=1 Tax=Neobacillus niacini TaxID=86668 RepID=UPI00285941BA|nr:hypothetical protein [Neobacillus niacini]MDR7079362.1 hypothetical protein [Neobacillus niacini]